MLKNFNKVIKNDNKIIYRNSSYYITNKEDQDSKNIVANINKEIFILLSHIQESNLEQAKLKENDFNKKEKKNNLPNDNFGSSCKDKIIDKTLRRHIQKEIYELLNDKGSLTKSEIIKYIPIFEKDPDSNYHIISKEIDFLLDIKGLLDKLDNDKYTRLYPDFEDYYNKNLKELDYED